MNETALITTLSDRSLPWLVVLTLMSARFIGLALVFPLFSWLNLPMTVRFAFAAAMALPLMPAMIGAELQTIKTLSAATIGLLGAKELFIGVLIGTIAGLPFWMAQSGGETIDSYRGSTAGTLFDPSLTTETSELGSVFMLAALSVLIWGGGIGVLMATMFASYAIWPPLELAPQFGKDAAAAIGVLIGSSVRGALGIAGTLLILLFAIDLALALASRSSRQFQVFELSLNIKNLAFVLVIPLLILPLLQLIATEVDGIGRVLQALQALAR